MTQPYKPPDAAPTFTPEGKMRYCTRDRIIGSVPFEACCRVLGTRTPLDPDLAVSWPGCAHGDGLGEIPLATPSDSALLAG